GLYFFADCIQRLDEPHLIAVNHLMRNF
ncbi:MAG: hypothetical protein QOF42_753, partial [Gammaproteobacteria bacterium]|nr:hypothetical protein [Gammaproteobacteria bacterium]